MFFDDFDESKVDLNDFNVEKFSVIPFRSSFKKSISIISPVKSYPSDPIEPAEQQLNIELKEINKQENYNMLSEPEIMDQSNQKDDISKKAMKNKIFPRPILNDNKSKFAKPNSKLILDSAIKENTFGFNQKQLELLENPKLNENDYGIITPKEVKSNEYLTSLNRLNDKSKDETKIALRKKGLIPLETKHKKVSIANPNPPVTKIKPQISSSKLKALDNPVPSTSSCLELSKQNTKFRAHAHTEKIGYLDYLKNTCGFNKKHTYSYRFYKSLIHYFENHLDIAQVVRVNYDLEMIKYLLFSHLKGYQDLFKIKVSIQDLLIDEFSKE